MSSSSLSDHSRDERLATLMSEALDSISRGQHVDLQQLCESNPDLAGDLRELWGAMLLTQAAAEGSAGQNAEPRSRLPVSSLFELPYRMDGFLLEQELGRGGMGVVYRAKRLSTGEPVAIKMMLKGEFASAVERQRFEAEAAAAGRLQRPN
ncbi:MAG TPA: serine/threonine protein kinase, partial [Pirellulaceae bacterium]|nr:serine/threonine protein kinase [Pirellulaceae bacterium]